MDYEIHNNNYCILNLYIFTNTLLVYTSNFNNKNNLELDIIYFCSRTKMTEDFSTSPQRSSLSFIVVPSEYNLKLFSRITRYMCHGVCNLVVSVLDYKSMCHGVCSLVVSVLDYRSKGHEFETQTRRIFFLSLSFYMISIEKKIIILKIH